MDVRQLAIVTDGAGAFAGRLPAMNGLLAQLRLVQDGTVPLAGTAVLVLQGATSGVVLAADSTIANALGAGAGRTRQPRSFAQTTAGVTLTYDGMNTIPEPIAIANESIDVTITTGGANARATLFVWTRDA